MPEPNKQQTPHRVLLTRLEAERAHHEECANLSRIDETRIAHSSMAAGLHLAALRLVEVFEGPEAAREYMQRTTPESAQAAPAVVVAGDRGPAPGAGLREQYAEALAAAFTTDGRINQGMRFRFEGADGWPASREVNPLEATDVVLAVRDRRVEQLTARVAELEKQVAEDADDYHVLADHTDTTCEAVQRRDTAEAALERVRDLAADMRTRCSPRGIAVDYADRIDEALEGPAVERTEEAS